MFRTAVTISLVSQTRGGPFVFWDDLPASLKRAAEIGFDAVELFLPGPDAVVPEMLRALLSEHRLNVAAVGTGAGMVVHQLSLSDPDAERRARAVEFVTSMMQLGAEFGAPAIIGSMQGRWTPATGKEVAVKHLTDSLHQLSRTAGTLGVPLIYEPLNRYETNFCNTLAEGVRLIQQGQLENVLLLADLFHMNIEEIDLAHALRQAGHHVGHIHFVDSNRRPAGCGHLHFPAIFSELREMGYQGYLSAEAFPWPDSDQAAVTTMKTFRRVIELAETDSSASHRGVPEGR